MIELSKWFVLLAFVSTLTSGRVEAGQNCPPFFDFSQDKVVSNVVGSNGLLAQWEIDITPEPQPLTAFGEAVLEVCGRFGSKVDPRAVQALAERFSPDLIKLLAREYPKASDSQIRGAVAQAWAGANGFEHVFCGQPRLDKVSGLHFAGRYLELQKRGQLCRLENNLPNEEILPLNVYTIGVSLPGGTIDRKKGFSVRQTAEDIFFEGARTYLRNCQSPSKDRKVCISRFYKDNSFGSLFVCAPGRGIVTMYPRATTAKSEKACF